ncbi:MAG: hypothetical protein LBL58_02695 [Tannerellaceae bacterium]|nr:hypothetical protein [Tannerellaceae bacterium]
MSIDHVQGGSASFTGTQQQQSYTVISSGWATPWEITLTCSTGKLSSFGK